MSTIDADVSLDLRFEQRGAGVGTGPNDVVWARPSPDTEALTAAYVAGASRERVLLRAAIEALPVHHISGYEWECYEQDTGCHWHWTGKPCTYGHEVTTEGNFDRDGVSCDHDRLVDLDRILAVFS